MSPLTNRRAKTPLKKLLSATACLLLVLAGCPSTESPPDDRAGTLTPQDVKLSLWVVDDPALATAIERLEGEWNAQTGSGYRVEQVSQSDLAEAQTLHADAVICPSALLGAVAERHGVVPVPEELLESEQAGWAEIFSLLRSREAVWGRQIVGVPFGSPVLTVYYRADLLAELGRKPPRTWAEYQELAQLLARRSPSDREAPAEDSPWCGAIEPLGPGWAGLMLLARAAPYARHRENFSTLLNITTMEPLVDGPPLVRALEELVAAAALGPPEPLSYDPAAVRAAFWQGECGLAVAWPSAAAELPSPPEVQIQAGLAELPGSTEAYDVAEQAWEPRPVGGDPHVPLLAVAGRMGMVTNNSKWPKPAFQLLFWLSGAQGTQTSPASPATTLFRNSHLGKPEAWVERRMSAAAAAQYAEVTRQALSRPQSLFALRIPGRSEYLAVLDEAVHQAVRGGKTPREALRQAADRWRKITARLGVEAQRQACWNSLGLE